MRESESEINEKNAQMTEKNAHAYEETKELKAATTLGKDKRHKNRCQAVTTDVQLLGKYTDSACSWRAFLRKAVSSNIKSYWNTPVLIRLMLSKKWS